MNKYLILYHIFLNLIMHKHTAFAAFEAGLSLNCVGSFEYAAQQINKILLYSSWGGTSWDILGKCLCILKLMNKHAVLSIFSTLS